MRARLLAAVGSLLLSAAPLLAQQGTSTIGGTVTDQGSLVLPGVTVTLTNEATGLTRDVVTSVGGSYIVTALPPGQYRLSAKLSGFKTFERGNIAAEVGRTTTIYVMLDVGGLEESVTVSAEAPMVDTRSAQVGGNIKSTEISELPQTTRSYMALVGNVPGAQFVPSNGFLNDTMLANGQPAAANSVNIDGASNVDDQRGSNVGGQARTANESLQEVQVMTNQFDAEWGRSSGAVVNAVTKSGTNRTSGSLFQFFTGRAVTAKDALTKVNNQEKPEVAKTEWGGTIGGPIIKNTLFYFFGLERVTEARPLVGNYPNRPELNYSSTDSVGAWNTFLRFDHQVTKNHMWALRWQREKAPQLQGKGPLPEVLKNDGDETDMDNTWVGTLTSVLSNTRVNTLRVSRTTEVFAHGQPLIRGLKPEYESCFVCPDQFLLDQSLLPPQLSYQTFAIQAGVTNNLWEDQSSSIEDTMSWFIPGKMGKHDVKVGAKATYVWISQPLNNNANGTFTFNHELVFDPANPRTYPERFSITVPGPRYFEMDSRVFEGYVQDKWQMDNGLTLSLGVRYDLEVIPINERYNPLIADPGEYPIDKNNFAPRVGVIWNPDGKGQTVFRGGWGLFYDKTILGTIDDFDQARKYSESFTGTFPQNAADPGPANGRFPTDPTLSNGIYDHLTPEVLAYINSVYPKGSTLRNTGTVVYDDPERKVPLFKQMSVGFSRQLFAGVSVNADYVRMRGTEQFLSPNLNLGTRATTARSGAVTFTDPFGILNPSLAPGEAPYVATVLLRPTKYGYSNYDALDISMEKRYSHGWSLRGAYSIGYSRGVTAGQGDTPQLQVGDDLNLDLWYAPANVDRRHNLTMSGRVEIPKTHGVVLSSTLRLLSGTPLTIQNTNIDADRNTIFFDPLAAGTYSANTDFGMHDVEFDGARNGARGPGYAQLDARVGYRTNLGGKLGGRRSVEVFGEFFNLANHANFTNPSGDLRNQADFLRYTALAPTRSRQAQLGLRFVF